MSVLRYLWLKVKCLVGMHRWLASSDKDDARKCCLICGLIAPVDVSKEV